MLGRWQSDIEGSMPAPTHLSHLEIGAGYTLGKRVPSQVVPVNIVGAPRLANAEAIFNYGNMPAYTRQTQIPPAMPAPNLSHRIMSHLGLVQIPNVTPGVT
jgi:hypothetical protein